MADESTPTCQRYLCTNPTTRVTGVVSKRDEVWVISACDEHGPQGQAHTVDCLPGECDPLCEVTDG